MGFSKSKYTRYVQCPKMLWMDNHKPEEKVEDPTKAKRFAQGHAVGELAKSYFGDFVEATAQNEDGGLDYAAMVARTKQYIEEGAENICEAAFSFYGNYCAVDILHKVEGGYEIYEVKSSTKVKPIYCADVAYQKYVLERCGVTVVNAYVVFVNNKYVQQGEATGAADIPLDRFLTIQNVNKEILPFYNLVAKNLSDARGYLAQENEPQSPLGGRCKNPYMCEYYRYCTGKLPSPNVFDLYKITLDKAREYCDNGIVTYQDLAHAGVSLNTVQRLQVEHSLRAQATRVDRENVETFLNSLKFPLQFFDFEAFSTAIPKYDGQRPYQQIPFQYSLHALDKSGELEHKEFLGVEGTDPRRAIAQSLVENIPDNASVIVYNKKFESKVLEELATYCPEYGERLLKIKDNIVDLEEIFDKGFVYNNAMGKSLSIKSVLPALFPNEPELDYHNLEGVHNGGEAPEVYEKLPTMSEEEKAAAKENLLKYCKLDTYAMVKIYQWLVEHI